jgi:hypothetical protein
MVIAVRIPTDVYDAYCKTSNESDVPIRSIMRHILTAHAPWSRAERRRA